MKEFIKNHFKFIFIVVCFTFLISEFSRGCNRKYELIESNIKLIDFMQDESIKCILMRFNDLEKELNEIKTTVGVSAEVLFDEIRILDAHQYVSYAEIIKCFNHYHQNCDYEPIDFVELSKSFYKYYFDIKKEKHNQILKECSEKKIKIETH